MALTVFTLIGLSLATPALAAGNTAEQVRQGLEDAFAGEIAPAILAKGDAWAQALREFYDARQYRPVWIGGYGPHPDADTLLTTLWRARQDGLDPLAYDVDSLERLLAADQGPDTLLRLELGLSQALLKYTSDLRKGRLPSDRLEADLPPNGRVLAPVSLLESAAAAADLGGYLQRLRPDNPHYRRLREALDRYREIADAGEWPTLSGGPSLKKDMRAPEVATLRARLRRTGDLGGGSQDPELFDDALDAAVKRFQRRHGLEDDGIVGPKTRHALNVPASQRVRQIVLNLERWRWMPDDLGERHILVNLAGFEVDLVEHGETRLRMRAVVGRPYRSTPVFSDEITYLEFNPTWTVPPTIARKDVLPEARKDPGYFAKENMAVYRGWAADAPALDPATIDWANVDPRRIPFRFVQRPGPKNALGRVKFMFPNRHHVYLHDTPQRQLFERAQRSFSSGCIRIDKPMELAEALLSGVPGWDRGKIDSVVAKGTRTRVRLARAVPIHLAYATVWVDEAGTIRFGPDIYGRDTRLDRALTAMASR